MGMFDTIYSAYPVFGCPYDHELQTKDLENLMLRYTIDPDGHLYEIETHGTWDLVPLAEEQKREGLADFEAKPNGRHGKVRPVIYSGKVMVYPAKYYGNPSRMPCAVLWFNEGVLTSIHRDTAAGMRNSGRYPMP